MSIIRQRPRLCIGNNGPGKNITDCSKSLSQNLGNLSPDLNYASSPPKFPEREDDAHSSVLQIGKYLLVQRVDTSSTFETYNAWNVETHDHVICKVFAIEKYRELLSAYWQSDGHDTILSIGEIILGATKAYIFFPRGFSDLHSHVRQKKRLREDEAKSLFRQIIEAVDHCHNNGVVLRDLKLRKFVFKDEEKRQLRLEGLEDAAVFEDNNDQLYDKHGCPAYVSPEILNANRSYSGRSADIWSLGVMLYTMLVGRYPFHDTEPGALFGKIRRGQFNIPDTVSSKAKCLIRNLLRRDPTERLTARDILKHPWLASRGRTSFVYIRSNIKTTDRDVPDVQCGAEPRKHAAAANIDDNIFDLSL